MIRARLVLIAISVAFIGPAVYSLKRLASDHDADLTLISSGYHLDKIYRSMEGPWSVQKNIQLRAPSSDPQSSITWLTGIETEVVDAKSQARVSQEFFCHANLTFAEDSADKAQLGSKTNIDSRLFTLAPGRTSIAFPRGFGLPIHSGASLDYLTMSLNLNPHPEAVNVRMRTTLHAVGPDDADAPTKPLFRRAVYVLQHQDGAEHKICNVKSEIEHPGLGCGDWKKVGLANGSTMLMPAQDMTNHWTVPEGDHIYTTDIAPQLNLPFDTTIHYATIHVHPFARWMELRDLTTGQTVLKLNSQDWPDRVGVVHVDEFKSIEGIPIVRSHHYELAVEYNNTSGTATDAMAILYLYLLDKNA